MEVGQSTLLYTELAPQELDLLDIFGDTEVTVFGITGTFSDLGSMCPIDLSNPQITLEAKNAFVVQAANAAGLEIQPEYEPIFSHYIEQKNLEQKFTVSEKRTEASEQNQIPQARAEVIIQNQKHSLEYAGEITIRSEAIFESSVLQQVPDVQQSNQTRVVKTKLTTTNELIDPSVHEELTLIGIVATGTEIENPSEPTDLLSNTDKIPEDLLQHVAGRKKVVLHASDFENEKGLLKKATILPTLKATRQKVRHQLQTIRVEAAAEPGLMALVEPAAAKVEQAANIITKNLVFHSEAMANDKFDVVFELPLPAQELYNQFAPILDELGEQEEEQLILQNLIAGQHLGNSSILELLKSSLVNESDNALPDYELPILPWLNPENWLQEEQSAYPESPHLVNKAILKLSEAASSDNEEAVAIHKLFMEIAELPDAIDINDNERLPILESQLRVLYTELLELAGIDFSEELIEAFMGITYISYLRNASVGGPESASKDVKLPKADLTNPEMMAYLMKCGRNRKQTLLKHFYMLGKSVLSMYRLEQSPEPLFTS
jgi:hypothetical protein